MSFFLSQDPHAFHTFKLHQHREQVPPTAYVYPRPPERHVALFFPPAWLVTFVVFPAVWMCVRVVSLPLHVSLVLMETRIPGGPPLPSPPLNSSPHQNKSRESSPLAFQTNITHFLCCQRDGGARRFISQSTPTPPPLPCYRLAPFPSLKTKRPSKRGRRIPRKGQLMAATAVKWTLKVGIFIFKMDPAILKLLPWVLWGHRTWQPRPLLINRPYRVHSLESGVTRSLSWLTLGREAGDSLDWALANHRAYCMSTNNHLDSSCGQLTGKTTASQELNPERHNYEAAVLTTKLYGAYKKYVPNFKQFPGGCSVTCSRKNTTRIKKIIWHTLAGEFGFELCRKSVKRNQERGRKLALH